MSIQTDLVALLGGLFAGRMYPQTAHTNAVAPYCTYSRVTATEEATLDPNGGTGNEVNTRMQIDVWALSYAEAQSKAAAVKAALKGSVIENVTLSELDMYEDDTGLHRVMLDVSTWHT